MQKLNIDRNLSQPDDQQGFLQALLGDGRPLLFFVGLMLVLSGGFALFLSITHQLLPHDIQFLEMTESQLCAIADCRVLHFMFHDRTAFGGALIAIGILYLWMAEFPLRYGKAWAWWLFAVSGKIGFVSFLAYLSYGYFDFWHATATILLLPFFITGLGKSFFGLRKPRGIKSLFVSADFSWKTAAGFGRLCLLSTAAEMIIGGTVITLVGMTSVFVPEDLMFMDVTVGDLNAASPRLVPLIAHDRAGFGGALATTGIIVLFCVWCSAPSRNLWQALALAGAVGFGTAIGVHPIIGYNNLLHLAPAFLGAIIFVAGLFFSYKQYPFGSEKG